LIVHVSPSPSQRSLHLRVLHRSRSARTDPLRPFVYSRTCSRTNFPLNITHQDTTVGFLERSIVVADVQQHAKDPPPVRELSRRIGISETKKKRRKGTSLNCTSLNPHKAHFAQTTLQVDRHRAHFEQCALRVHRHRGHFFVQSSLLWTVTKYTRNLPRVYLPNSGFSAVPKVHPSSGGASLMYPPYTLERGGK
jgi:hypothetical protein